MIVTDIKFNGFNGVKILESEIHYDDRGTFTKNFSYGVYNEFMKGEIKEIYHSTSIKDTLRGMHFLKDASPVGYEKIIHVISGTILDVIVDIREDSLTFGEYLCTTLSSLENKSIYIDKGFAHGFLVLSSIATVLYVVTSEYDREADTGIRWDSFGFGWNGVSDLVISDRDKKFKKLDEFYE